MSEFRKGRSHAETRNLKEWSPGRLSQLNLWVQHLQQAFDFNSLAAQVLQSPKRKFSEFVPKIVEQDITTEVEFKEIRLTWAAPKGLRFFLFYEIQVSLFENFAQFDSFVSYDPFFVFPNLQSGKTYYFRIRVLNKDQLFGPWSNTINVDTPFASGFTLFDGASTHKNFTANDFVTVYSQDYEAVGGELYYGIDYEFYVALRDHLLSHADAEFRWTVDGVQVGRAFNVSSISSKDADADIITGDVGTQFTDSLQIPSPFVLARRGTFLQKFASITSGDHIIQLQARLLTNIHPTPNDWISAPEFYYDDNTGSIKVRNFFVFEFLVDS